VLGAAGALVCIGSVLARIAGNHYMLGIESMTLFNGGIALMVMGCLARLHAGSGAR
jgi:hypothetical protein